MDCALSFLSNRKRCKACVQHLLVRHPFVFLTCGKEAKFLLESAQNKKKIVDLTSGETTR